MSPNNSLEHWVQRAEVAARSASSSETAALASAAAAQETFNELKLSKWEKKPHYYTLFLSGASLLLTILAVVFTYRGYFNSVEALQVSEKSLHFGQRAYIAVRQGRLELVNQKVRPDYWSPNRKRNGGWSYTNPKDAAKVDWKHLRALFSFELQNVGNSPAKITSIEYTLRMPAGWNTDNLPAESVRGHLTNEAHAGRDKVMSAESGEEIEPHSSVFLDADPPLVLEATAADYVSLKFQRIGQYKPDSGTFYSSPNERLVIQGNIRYADIFENTHSVHWCWAHNYLSVYADACTPAEASARR